MLVGLGVPYAIIRPTLVFGVGDLLLNNMAWALRRFPVFPVYGNGDYPVQPIYVEDLAVQAVEAGSQSESSVADAAGPDTFSFEDLLRLLASAMGIRRWFLHTPPRVSGLAGAGKEECNEIISSEVNQVCRVTIMLQLTQQVLRSKIASVPCGVANVLLLHATDCRPSAKMGHKRG